MQLDPTLPACEPGAVLQRVPIFIGCATQPLKQPQRDNPPQRFQRCIGQPTVRRALDAEEGVLIDIERHRRADQQQQRTISQGVDFLR
ncbi:hypothetical protein DBR14_09670 [Pseudomonas sp. HMWF034]|nr:hypothetical protein DBR14_09670 [Pseudomonas sp. HMWF034]